MDEIEKSFNSCFKVLKFYGLWIDDVKSTKKWQTLGIFRMIFGLIFFWCMLLAGICKSEISLELAHSITFFVACSVAIARISDCLIKNDNIKQLYESIQQIMKNDVKNDKFIIKRLKFYKKVFVTIIVNSYISVVAGFVLSFISHQYPYPVAVPLNIDVTEIGFYVVNTYLSIALCYIAPVYTCLGWYPMFFMNFAVGLMEDFNERLTNFGKIANENNEEYEVTLTNELHKIIEVHDKIKEFFRNFVKIFRLTFFIKGIAGSIILCTALFAISMVI